MKNLHLSAVGLTDKGRVREQNEDAILVLPEAGIFALADGMGGLSGGQIASTRTLQIIADELVSVTSVATLCEKQIVIERAVCKADCWIKEWVKREGVSGAGTTLVVLALQTQGYGAIFFAGDSRCYRLRDGQLKQLSRDHSVATALGQKSDKAIPQSLRNIVTNAIGAKRFYRLESRVVEIRTGDLYMLCSDGLTRMIEDPEMLRIFRNNRAADLSTIAQALIDSANDVGGNDNISVILVRLPPPKKRIVQ